MLFWFEGWALAIGWLFGTENYIIRQRHGSHVFESTAVPRLLLPLQQQMLRLVLLATVSLLSLLPRLLLLQQPQPSYQIDGNARCCD